MIVKILRKIKRDGFIVTLKTIAQIVHNRFLSPDWDFEIVGAILENEVALGNQVTIIQIGANTGNTDSEQIHGFLTKYCSPNSVMKSVCSAVLVEPVTYLFEQLVKNYAGYRGVFCENVAVAENAGTRSFYRLREGIDLESNGLAPWSEQLGSFIPKQMESLWQHDPKNTRLRKFVENNIVTDEVTCVSIKDLIAKHELTSVNLLLIDTEGYDYMILKTIDFKLFSPCYINFERIHLKKDEPRCRAMLTKNGYRLHDHGQDTLCEHVGRLSNLEILREKVYCIWLNIIY